MVVFVSWDRTSGATEDRRDPEEQREERSSGDVHASYEINTVLVVLHKRSPRLSHLVWSKREKASSSDAFKTAAFSLSARCCERRVV